MSYKFNIYYKSILLLGQVNVIYFLATYLIYISGDYNNTKKYNT